MSLADIFAKLEVDDPAEIAKATRRGKSRTRPDDNRQDPMQVHEASDGGEESLWVAVILQAFSDGRCSDPHDLAAARAFLLNDVGKRASDREWVCGLIGLDPEWLRRKAEQFFARLDAVDADPNGNRRSIKNIRKMPGKTYGKRHADLAAA